MVLSLRRQKASMIFLTRRRLYVSSPCSGSSRISSSGSFTKARAARQGVARRWTVAGKACPSNAPHRKYPSTTRTQPSGRHADVCTNRCCRAVRKLRFRWQAGFSDSTVHLRTDVTYMLLDFPNALSRTSLTAEQTDVAGIRLRIVRTYQTE